MPQKFKRGTDLMNVSLQYVGLIYMPVMRAEDRSGPKSMVQTPDTKCDTVGIQSYRFSKEIRRGGIQIRARLRMWWV